MADLHKTDSLESELQLALVSGVGPRLRRRLLDYFGTADEVLSAAPSQLRQVAGIGRQLALDISTARHQIHVARELQLCDDHGIVVHTIDDDTYPRPLKEIHDPPFALFCKGDLHPTDALAIAIVGTRHATSYGKRVTERLATGLARAGLTVVSGMARGIDATAHRAALEAGGRTIGVLAGGLLNEYPPDHRELAFDVIHDGTLLSEYPCHWPIKRGAFPRRNRIITGLSLGVIVIEAGDRSGALISAHHAIEQGREVMAVPGPIDSRVSRGCHGLLREGATLVESVDAVLEALGPLVESAQSRRGETIRHPAELQLNEQEQLVLQCVEVQPTSVDQIVNASQLPVHRVLSTLSALEMRRLVRRLSGQTVCRV